MGIPSSWRHIGARYILIGTKCTTCEEYFFPPRTMCPVCRRDGTIEEHRFKGTGEVITYTVIRAPAKGHSGPTPYVLAIIKLGEGPRLTGQIVNINPEDIKIGMRVKEVFRRLGKDGGKGIIYYGTKFEPE